MVESRRGKRTDLTDKVFGLWTALKPVGTTHNGKKIIKWKCACACGNFGEVVTGDLIRGHSKSCGCRKRTANGKRIDKKGYVLVRNQSHPNASSWGEVCQHVDVMSKHLGRPIMKNEHIHHKNGIKSDNRIENLELWSSVHPYGQRVADMIIFCEAYLKQHKPEALAPAS